MFAPLTARTQTAAASSRTKKPAPRAFEIRGATIRTTGAAERAHLLQPVLWQSSNSTPSGTGSSWPDREGTASVRYCTPHRRPDRSYTGEAQRSCGRRTDCRSQHSGRPIRARGRQVAQQALNPAEQQPQRRNLRPPGCSRNAEGATGYQIPGSPNRSGSDRMAQHRRSGRGARGVALVLSAARSADAKHSSRRVSGRIFARSRVHTDAVAAGTRRER